ncbi:Hypothetical protein CINCED_3A021324 [Cinara cedri]|uniref:Uncharacterized protein n=1 Tax=Cinara cedri TaxID=506608 RepID=A0A5E4MIF0_9HEMI|nr:Hypothetical protein CINCED_3A021324 [Cinara cedri]
MEKQKQFIPERLNNYIIDGCQHCSKTDRLELKCLKESGPRIPLAGVKTFLYNPLQLSLRMYEIENIQGKYVNELSRKTFPLELATLIQNLNKPMFESPRIIYPGYDLLPLTKINLNQENNDEESSFLKNRDISDSWKTYLDNLPLSKSKVSTNKSLRVFITGLQQKDSQN